MTNLTFQHYQGQVYNVLNNGSKIGYIAKHPDGFWFCDIYPEFINNKVLGWHEQSVDTLEDVKVRAIEIYNQYS